MCYWKFWGPLLPISIPILMWILLTCKGLLCRWEQFSVFGHMHKRFQTFFIVHVWVIFFNIQKTRSNRTSTNVIPTLVWVLIRSLFRSIRLSLIDTLMTSIWKSQATSFLSYNVHKIFRKLCSSEIWTHWKFLVDAIMLFVTKLGVHTAHRFVGWWYPHQPFRAEG